MSMNRDRTGDSGNFDRRGFLKTAAATAGGVAALNLGLPTASGANDRLGIGIIGCGGRSGAHQRSLNWLKTQANRNIDIVAACDVYKPRLDRVAKHFKAKGYMDHRDLLRDKNVDVVCIATPDHHHAQQSIDAFKAGKDVYCEKPFTHWRQFEPAKRAAKVAEETGRVFQLGTQGMSCSAWRQAKKLIDDGLIGQPIHAECGYYRVGDWGERGMSVDDPKAKPGAELNWKAFLGDAPDRPFDVSRFFRWRMYEDYSGGPVTDLYPHSFTPMAYMLGGLFPSIVVAVGGKLRYQKREVPDSFNMLVDYQQKTHVAVMGTQGNGYCDRFKPCGSVGRAPIVRGWEGTLTFEGSEIVFIPVNPKKKKPKKFKVENGENTVNHWENLLDCVRANDPNTFSPMKLAYAVQTTFIMGVWGFRQGKVAGFNADKEKIEM